MVNELLRRIASQKALARIVRQRATRNVFTIFMPGTCLCCVKNVGVSQHDWSHLLLLIISHRMEEYGPSTKGKPGQMARNSRQCHKSPASASFSIRREWRAGGRKRAGTTPTPSLSQQPERWTRFRSGKKTILSEEQIASA